MNTTTTIETTAVELRRTFPVSRERLFAAWTDPEEARQWFGGDRCTVQDFQMDARPGGKYIISTAGCSTSGITRVGGEFLEVAPPAKLVYTWRWLDDPDWEGIDSRITVRFTEKPDGTEVHLTHERFPSIESRGNHEKGWSGSFDKLARHLER